MYQIDIRDGKGAVLADGASRAGEEWYEACLRIARAAKLCSTRDRIGASEYFATSAGAPYGTHHVQFGHRLRGGGGVTLGRRYVVHVDDADEGAPQ